MSDSYLKFDVDQNGPMGSKIKELIIRSHNIIVYIDENDTIQWATHGITLEKDFGDIQNKVSFWEDVSNKIFTKQDAYSCKCLLAEAYARILEDRDPKLANEIIERTVYRIQKHGSEILKQAYLLSSVVCVIVLFFILGTVVVERNKILSIIPFDAYSILLTSIFGGIGAFVFTTLRLKNYTPEVIISKRIHQIDGALRIFYGIISGLIIALGIKSNIVLGFINQIQITIYLKAFLGVIAGASEIVIPNLIKGVEHKIETGKIKA